MAAGFEQGLISRTTNHRTVHLDGKIQGMCVGFTSADQRSTSNAKTCFKTDKGGQKHYFTVNHGHPVYFYKESENSTELDLYLLDIEFKEALELLLAYKPWHVVSEIIVPTVFYLKTTYCRLPKDICQKYLALIDQYDLTSMIEPDTLDKQDSFSF